MRRNAELSCKNFSVTCRLVQHIHEVRVFKDILNFAAREQIFNVLRNTCGNTAPFTEALPDFHRVVCRLFLFEKQMELVNIVPCGLLCRTVDSHSVPHLILYDQHTDLFKLLSKLFNIETDKTIIQLDIGSVVEDVQTTVNVDFKSGRNTLCLVLLLCS